jgi:hypothetical protein
MPIRSLVLQPCGVAMRATLLPPLWVVRPVRRGCCDCWRRFRASGVAIPDIQPQRSIIAQHAPHFAEHLDHARHELVRRRLKAHLPFVAVVAQPEVGRARDAAIHARVGQFAQPFAAVANEDADRSCGPHGSDGGVGRLLRTVAGRAAHRANLRCLGHSATINYRDPLSDEGHHRNRHRIAECLVTRTVSSRLSTIGNKRVVVGETLQAFALARRQATDGRSCHDALRLTATSRRLLRQGERAALAELGRLLGREGDQVRP